MTNRHDMSRLENFLDGELSPAEEKAFLAELEKSAELQDELAAAQKLKILMSRLPAPEPDQTYFDEVTDLILARTTEQDEALPAPTIAIPERRFSFVHIALPVAAAILLFFGALSYSQSRQNQSTIVLPLNEYQEITARNASDHSDESWHISETELTEMSIGISAGAPGRGGGLASLSDVISVRYR